MPSPPPPVGEPPLQERDPTAAAFLDWILSDQGQQLIEQTGYVPWNEALPVPIPLWYADGAKIKTRPGR